MLGFPMIFPWEAPPQKTSLRSKWMALWSPVAPMDTLGRKQKSWMRQRWPRPFSRRKRSSSSAVHWPAWKMGQQEYVGFHKLKYPKIDGFLWKILLKWMIWRYPHSGNPHISDEPTILGRIGDLLSAGESTICFDGFLTQISEKTPNQPPALRINDHESATTNQRPHNENQRPSFSDQRPNMGINDHGSTTKNQGLHARPLGIKFYN